MDRGVQIRFVVIMTDGDEYKFEKGDEADLFVTTFERRVARLKIIYTNAIVEVMPDWEIGIAVYDRHGGIITIFPRHYKVFSSAVAVEKYYMEKDTYRLPEDEVTSKYSYEEVTISVINNEEEGVCSTSCSDTKQ